LCRPDLAWPDHRDHNENTSNIVKEPGGKRVAAKFEIRQPKAGEFRWVLVSQGRTLATSESYTRKVSAEKAIESLRKAAATATVNDTTVKPAAAKPAAAKAARATGKAVGKAAATTRKTAKTAAKAAAKAPAAAKTTVKRAAKTVEKTVAAPAKKAPTRKRTTRNA
jgi:uncharacterized protein YegP (UPF0339 family)